MKKRNAHNGGFQLPLIVPHSDWVRPAELPDLRGYRYVALDRETRDEGLAHGRGPGWATGAGHVAGNSIAWRDIDGTLRSIYIPLQHPDSDCFDRDAVRRWEMDHAAAGVRWVMQNASYDVGWGERDLAVPVPPLVDDAICMASMVDENRLEYNLDALCRWRGVPGKNEDLLREAAAAWSLSPKQDLWQLPARYVGPYAEADAVATLLLAESLRADIEREQTTDAYQLEMDLLPLIHAMRKRGIRVDVERAQRGAARFDADCLSTLAELSRNLGHDATIESVRSSEWMVRTFNEQSIPIVVDPDSGRPTFDAKLIGKIDHWLPRLAVRAKQQHEAASKFLRNYVLGFAHGLDPRLHASINQFKSETGGTRTYRFSYSEPPLQQMPHRREDMAAAIRGVFLPEEGEVWSDLDYSQQEYRLIVHFGVRLFRGTRGRSFQRSADSAARAAQKYRDDPRTDFHSMVAQMTGLDRKPAKDANFAKAFGAGKDKFALMIGKSVEEATEIMRQYDDEMPFVQQMFEECEKKAQTSGHVRLLDGARAHFDAWEVQLWSDVRRAAVFAGHKVGPCTRAEADARRADPAHPWYGKMPRRAMCRKAMNTLIQGSAARQTKLAMRECWRAGLVPLLQMHDALSFSLSSEKDGQRAAEIMRDVVHLEIPMAVDQEYGSTWGNARKIEGRDKQILYSAKFDDAMNLVSRGLKDYRILSGDTIEWS